MLRFLSLNLVGWAFLILATPAAHAGLLFDATLDGAQEVPANASLATGYSTVLLNDLEDQITVNFSWSGLSAAATAAHIHGPALPGFNASPVFTFTGIGGVGISGSMPEQVFAITPAQVAALKEGLYYVNVHNSIYPGGEIRGQLALIPEPTMLSLLALGGLTLLRHKRR